MIKNEVNNKTHDQWQDAETEDAAADGTGAQPQKTMRGRNLRFHRLLNRFMLLHIRLVIRRLELRKLVNHRLKLRRLLVSRLVNRKLVIRRLVTRNLVSRRLVVRGLQRRHRFLSRIACLMTFDACKNKRDSDSWN